MAYDFEKDSREFYMQKNKPEIVNVPKANYIAVRGSGDPLYSFTNWRASDMRLSLYTDNIDEYLKRDNIVDYENANIIQLVDSLWSNADSDVEYIKKAYEFVRDNISHSADINEDLLTCSSSEVLAAGHGSIG